MNHTERELHIACKDWFSYQYPEYALLLHHSPNGERRDKKTGALLKAMGVRAGFPDLILLLHNKSHPFLCIEFKTEKTENTKKGYQSKEQKEWQHAVEEYAFARYAVVRSKEAFIELITDYLNNR